MGRSKADKLVGAIEAGGTKFICAVGTCPDDLEQTEFPTGNQPDQTLKDVTDWLEEGSDSRGRLCAIGIGSFGPLDLHPNSPAYGHITSTPKAGWQNVDILGTVRERFGAIPIGLDTDVNAAALGEYYWGNGSGLDDFVYITIGTGIGAGGLSGGRLLHGLVHPEMGHMMLPRMSGDTFEGSCPYHGACWEGLCSGPAILKRTGVPAKRLPEDHDAWSICAQYTASALANIVYVLSPTRIIIGGSVRKGGKLGEDRFIQMIREKVRIVLGDYIDSPLLKDNLDSYVVPPNLGDRAGIAGAMTLAQEALASQLP